jgi:hypothetical protein
MIIAGLIAAYLVLLGAGFGIALLLLRGSHRINIIECACLAWLFGNGAVSILLWLCGTFSSGLLLQGIITVLCIGLGIVGLRARAGVTFSFPSPRDAVEWTLAIILVLEITIIVFVGLKHTLGWDGLLNWEIKARYAFLNGGVMPESYYTSVSRAFTHPEYPLAVPLVGTWLYLWMGESNQFWVKSLFPLYYATGALLLALFATRLSGRRWVGLLMTVLLPFIPFIFASSGGVIVGYVDFPLSAVYLAALGYLLLVARNIQTSWGVFAASLTLLPWLKSEGSILWFVLALLGIGLGLQKKRPVDAVIAAMPGLLLLICWQAYLRIVHAVRPQDFFGPTLQLLHDNINRLIAISNLLGVELTELRHWSIFWLIGALAIIWLLVRRKRTGLLLVSAIVLPMCLYLLTYIFSAWPSYTAHLTSSLPRLLLHVLPATWLAVGLALADSTIEQTDATEGR